MTNTSFALSQLGQFLFPRRLGRRPRSKRLDRRWDRFVQRGNCNFSLGESRCGHMVPSNSTPSAFKKASLKSNGTASGSNSSVANGIESPASRIVYNRRLLSDAGRAPFRSYLAMADKQTSLQAPPGNYPGHNVTRRWACPRGGSPEVTVGRMKFEMSELQSWTEDRLLGLISGQIQESLTWEYKGCASFCNEGKAPNEIAKDVSSMANSAGGTIIYGMEEDKNHMPINLTGVLETRKLSREWLEQIINSKINRTIDNIRIQPVKLNMTVPNSTVFVVEIPQSLKGPHMAPDNKYYKRLNFMAVPMEDYEVRDTMRRQNVPDLNLDICCQPGSIRVVEENGQNLLEARLQVSVTNTSIEPAEHFIARIGFSDSVIVEFPGSYNSVPWTKNGPMTVGHNGRACCVEMRAKAFGLDTLGVPGFGPIGVVFEQSFSLQIPLEIIGDELILWELHAPRSDIKRGAFTVVKSNNEIVFTPHEFNSI